MSHVSPRGFRGQLGERIGLNRVLDATERPIKISLSIATENLS
jgi:hypothetical protein